MLWMEWIIRPGRRSRRFSIQVPRKSKLCRVEVGRGPASGVEGEQEGEDDTSTASR